MNDAPDGFQWVTIELSLKEDLSEPVVVAVDVGVTLGGVDERVMPVFTLVGVGEDVVRVDDTTCADVVFDCALSSLARRGQCRTTATQSAIFAPPGLLCS